MRVAGFDLETFGTYPTYALQPFRARTGDAWITSAVFKPDAGTGLKAHNDGKLIDKLRLCLQWAARNDVYIVGWNTPFDVAWLIASGLREEVYACKWLDAMLIYRHYEIHPTYELFGKHALSYSLKSAVRRFLPEHAGYEEGVDFGDQSEEGKAKRLDYNVADVDRTLELFWKFWFQLTEGQRTAALIEAESIPLMAEATVEGIHGDADAARALHDKLQADRNVAFVELKLTQTDIDEDVIASPKKLGALLFGSWGLTPTAYTPAGAPSTDREALLELATRDSRAALISRYREATNNQTKFAVGMLDSLTYNGDGCTRPQPRIFGTYTGRLTYSSSQGKGVNTLETGIALHQWKRDAVFRRLIKVPEGYTLVEFDFAGQEFRWMAVASGDATMLSLCAPGQDAHAYMGAQIRGLDVDELRARVKAGDKEAKDTRQLGKVANLSLQYRTSARRLRRMAAVQYGIALSETEADTIHQTYQRTYPGVVTYWKKQKYAVMRQPYIENLLGRRVTLFEPHKRQPEMQWSYISTAVNYPIQSMGAEQKFLALSVARDMLPAYDARFYFELHDGLFFIAPDEHAERFYEDMKTVFSNLPYKEAWGMDLPIPFPVDGKIGKNWGDLKGD